MLFIYIVLLLSLTLCNANQFKSFQSLKRFSTAVATLPLAFGLLNQPVFAIGPVKVGLNILSYKQVELCNGQKPIMPGR